MGGSGRSSAGGLRHHEAFLACRVDCQADGDRLVGVDAPAEGVSLHFRARTQLEDA
jgi:hypothetical protein